MISQKLFEMVLSEVAGEDVIPLVKVLRIKSNISEFKLAEIIKQEINQTRNMLYRLYNVNLVSFVRKKDKKKGWYIYYWTFNPERMYFLAEQLRQKKIEALQERLYREQNNQFFLCKNKCIRLDFEQASDFEYKCPECGELLETENNIGRIKNLEQELKELSAPIEEEKPVRKIKKSVKIVKIKKKKVLKHVKKTKVTSKRILTKVSKKKKK